MDWKFGDKIINNSSYIVVVVAVAHFMEIGKLLIENGTVKIYKRKTELVIMIIIINITIIILIQEAKEKNNQ